MDGGKRLVRGGAPWAVFVAALALTAGCLATGRPSAVAIGPLSAAVFAVAWFAPWRHALAAGGLSFGVVLPVYVVGAGHRREVWGAAPLIAAALLLPAVLAVVVRSRRASVARAGAEEIARRVAEERLEIAREFHDVLGHALAVIAMQAGVALHVRERRPRQVTTALEAVVQVSREALAELDATFGVFREVRESAAGRPEPGLDQLATLLGVLRPVGLDADLVLAGPRASLPPAVDHAAYRIVQESLTNVLHHSGAARATVELRYESAALSLRIENDEGAAPEAADSGGTGIPGMRERAVALGGTLEAGPRTEGGFLVTARLPLRGCGT